MWNAFVEAYYQEMQARILKLSNIGMHMPAIITTLYPDLEIESQEYKIIYQDLANRLEILLYNASHQG